MNYRRSAQVLPEALAGQNLPPAKVSFSAGWGEVVGQFNEPTCSAYLGDDESTPTTRALRRPQDEGENPAPADKNE